MRNQLSVQINSLVTSTAEVRWRPKAAVEFRVAEINFLSFYGKFFL